MVIARDNDENEAETGSIVDVSPAAAEQEWEKVWKPFDNLEIKNIVNFLDYL
jgi:hypothetical protein